MNDAMNDAMNDVRNDVRIRSFWDLAYARLNPILHLATRFPATERVGSWATPFEQRATACHPEGGVLVPPRRTLLRERVTCPTCKASEVCPREDDCGLPKNHPGKCWRLS